MDTLYLLLLIGGLVSLVEYLYYRRLNKLKDPKILFKDVHISPTIKSTSKKERL